MILYGLGTCDTCRKARKALPDAEFRDVRADGVPQDVLRSALETFGEALINTRSTTWRAMDADQREADPIDQLQAHPTLLKRPLIVDGDRMLLGWTPQVREVLGL